MTVLALQTENTNPRFNYSPDICHSKNDSETTIKTFFILRSGQQIKPKEIQRINQIIDRLQSGQFKVVD